MNSKYQKAAERIKEQEAFDEEQKALREKYKQPENVVIKEKSNTFKFTLSMLKNLIKIVAEIVLVALAATGLLSIIYPAPRQELIKLFFKMLHDVTGMM